MSLNTYRVGDHVYVEDTPAGPFDIRRIEELTRTPSGRVDAKLSCFFRRHDLTASLIGFADENLGALIEDESLNTRQRELLAERELFNSNILETVSASLIRGKCSVLKVSDVESAFSYLGKEDVFFYCFMYEPSVRTLMCDEGEIRVGPEYQSDVPPVLGKNETDPRNFETLETLLWTPEHDLSEDDIDRYLDKVKSVGTFARTLDSSSRIQQNSLLISAVSASRDITPFLAMDVLHKHDYDLSKALRAIVSPSMVIPRDELEDWSVAEANLFEEALEKIGKDFFAIRQEVLPWKSMKAIVEYYYMWKTSDRYSKQKTLKANEAKSRLGKINLPKIDNETNRNGPAVTTVSNWKKPCGNCGSVSSSQWFSVHVFGTGKVCQGCWEYWKKYAGIKKFNE
uniref:Metastasis-associated protein MTA3 n=3 Tax=Lygus hesperus TaxID=30085 RepID=A0A0A9ZAW7_LYGHE